MPRKIQVLPFMKDMEEAWGSKFEDSFCALDLYPYESIACLIMLKQSYSVIPLVTLFDERQENDASS